MTWHAKETVRGLSDLFHAMRFPHVSGCVEMCPVVCTTCGSELLEMWQTNALPNRRLMTLQRWWPR
jgi:hypothetical protein